MAMWTSTVGVRKELNAAQQEKSGEHTNAEIQITTSSVKIRRLHYSLFTGITTIVILTVCIIVLPVITKNKNKTTKTSTITPTTSQPRTKTTAMERPFVPLTQPGDSIVGLYNTRVGKSTNGSHGRYPNADEDPRHAIDFNVSTKYVNFGSTGGSSQDVYGPEIDTGFFVIPSISNATVARALLFATAHDFPGRDPITVTLEGSNATNNDTLHLGSSWTRIYSGPTGISYGVDPGRSVYVIRQSFSNTMSFASYRLLITLQCGLASSTQYSEAQIWGYA